MQMKTVRDQCIDYIAALRHKVRELREGRNTRNRAEHIKLYQRCIDELTRLVDDTSLSDEALRVPLTQIRARLRGIFFDTRGDDAHFAARVDAIAAMEACTDRFPR